MRLPREASKGYTAGLLISMSTFPMVMAQAGAGISGGMNIVFFGVLFAIMYFVLIRPQQRQAKEQQTMLAALKKGDDVVTSSGILGKVFAVDDKVITLEVSSGLKLRMLKSSVQGKVNVEPAKTEPNEAKKEEK